MPEEESADPKKIGNRINFGAYLLFLIFQTENFCLCTRHMFSGNSCSHCRFRVVNGTVVKMVPFSSCGVENRVQKKSIHVKKYAFKLQKNTIFYVFIDKKIRLYLKKIPIYEVFLQKNTCFLLFCKINIYFCCFWANKGYLSVIKAYLWYLSFNTLVEKGSGIGMIPCGRRKCAESVSSDCRLSLSDWNAVKSTAFPRVCKLGFASAFVEWCRFPL